MCCWRRNRPSSSSPRNRLPASLCSCAPTRLRPSPVRTFLSMADGPRTDQNFGRSPIFKRLKQRSSQQVLFMAPKSNAASSRSSPNPTKTINLALQGGGAHGAFGWGVMDKFLEDGRIAIEGISGTSAGSMNAVVYAYGKLKGNDG